MAKQNTLETIRPASPSADSTREQSHLYRTIWRWHFYAGLFCIPFMVTLALSGAIYLFKPQIDYWVERDFQNIVGHGFRSSPQSHIDSARFAVPGSQFVNYRLPDHDAQAVVVTLMSEGSRKLVYIDPYSREVLKIKSFDKQFIRLVRTFHGELLAGKFGSIMVELAGCWAIVLIITGLYLWWPRSSRGLAGVLFPRVRAGKRVFWRDLHSVTGLWIAFFTLFLLVSGLPWALVWGSAFKEIRGMLDVSPAVVQLKPDWQVREQVQEFATRSNAPELTHSVIETAKRLEMAPPVLLERSKNDAKTWVARSRSQNRPLRADAFIDGETAELATLTTFSDKKLIDRIIGIGIAAHEGHLFGWANIVLGLLICVGVLVLCVSGVVLWLRKRPRNKLGAPPMAHVARVTTVVWGVTILLALFLPLLGISLALLVIFDYLVLRRLPVVGRWLGTS